MFGRPRTVALAICLNGPVPDGVFCQWLEVLRARPWPGPVYWQRNLYVTSARNQVTRKALKDSRPWDDLLMIDSDHAPAPGLPDRLAEIGGRHPVVVGPYFQRQYPYEIEAWDLDPAIQGLLPIHPRRVLEMMQRPGLYPVGGGGTGCLLLTRELLQDMRRLKGRKVWETPEIEEPLRTQLAERGQLTNSDDWGEDTWFCMEVARRLGVQVMLDSDPRMQTSHWGYEGHDLRNYAATHLVTAAAPAGAEKALRGRGYAVEAAR